MPEEEKSLTEAIRQSTTWLRRCRSLTDAQSDIKNSDRNRVAASLFHLAMEHHSSILHLARTKHYGSAFALIRSQLEAYIRGVWIHRCATYKEIAHFLANNQPPKIEQLIINIESLPVFENGSLSRFKKKIWKISCDFNHGGYAQISWRLSGNKIVSDFGDEQIIMLLDIANTFTLQTVTELSVLAESEDMAQKVKAIHEEEFGSKHSSSVI